MSEHTSRRDMTYTYTLIDDNGCEKPVCKTFFLATLGFEPKNDSIITTLMRTTPPGHTPAKDKRGGSTKADRFCSKYINYLQHN